VPSFKSLPSLVGLAATAGLLAACSGGAAGDRYPAPLSAAFRADDFAWSAGQGQGAIEGRVDFRQDGQIYACTGSVALTPDTPYTRARFRTLYGSTDRAAVPEAVVRARTVPDPDADYRSYVRSAVCQNGRFSFSGLPDGGWFLIVPVSAGGDNRVVLMRRVVTRGGRISINL
jgi:hypothetical protein